MEVLMTNESKAPAAGGAPKKLSARGLVKRFDGKEVLHALDFDVLDGEFLSILGPSGCGKTTTLRILIGLLMPDEGTLTLGGRDITTAPPDDRGMGSSNRMTSGFSASVRAMDTRCCWPPESWRTLLSRCSASPSCSSTPCAISRRRAFSSGLNFSADSTFPRTVMFSNSA